MEKILYKKDGLLYLNAGIVPPNVIEVVVKNESSQTEKVISLNGDLKAGADTKTPHSLYFLINGMKVFVQKDYIFNEREEKVISAATKKEDAVESIIEGIVEKYKRRINNAIDVQKLAETE